MYFLIDFYDFPTFKTENLIYEECPKIEDIRVWILFIIIENNRLWLRVKISLRKLFHK